MKWFKYLYPTCVKPAYRSQTKIAILDQ